MKHVSTTQNIVAPNRILPVDQIARAALADPRTVRKVLLGEAVRPLARKRIEGALQRLGLAL